MEDKAFSDISYETFLNEEKLMGSRCKKCNDLFVPPRPICVACHGSDMVWEEMKGKGKLAAFTCIAIGPSFMIEEGFNRNNPYCTGVVQLDEGAKVDARIEGVDPKNPETIKIGMPLTIEYLHRKKDGKVKTYLAFKPL
jgi:uncharacterized OB-fold protein